MKLKVYICRVSVSFIMIFMLHSIAFSQKNSGVIQGKLIDSASKSALKFGTITVYNSVDSSLITFRLSDIDGKFKVNNLPVNTPISLVVSFTGYQTLRKDLKISSEYNSTPEITFELTRSSGMLDVITVVGQRPPVIVKNDTIEFNAGSFKVLPNAIVEDLLKKLPGVEIDQQGAIKVNGRVVTRLMVDSKEFFGSDPRIATKNLPAEVIDKIQVTTDNENLAQNPSAAVDQTGVVLNLTLKKNAKKGAFGKLYAGVGTQKMYESGGLINIFRDTLQISLIGYGNNNNAPAFGSNDLLSLGGFRRSSFKNMNLNADGSVANIDGLSFGGSTVGIPKNSGGGINLNTLIAKDLTVNFQYFYTFSGNRLSQINITNQKIADTLLSTEEHRFEKQSQQSHLITTSLRFKPNNYVNLLFRPSIAINKVIGDNGKNYSSESSYYSPLNMSSNTDYIKNDQRSYTHELNYTNNKVGKVGRSLSIFHSLSIGKTKGVQYSLASSYFYRNNSSLELDQFRPSLLSKGLGNLTINYTESLNSKFTFRIIENANLFTENDNLTVYTKDLGNGLYELIQDSLSYSLKRNGLRSIFNPYFIWSISKKLSIFTGANLHSIYIKNQSGKFGSLNQSYNRLFPYIQIRFEPFSLIYATQMSEPNIVDLFPVVNNSNPLYIIKGNPALLPTISHNISFSTSKYYQKRLLSFYFTQRSSFYQHAIVRSKSFNTDGVQTVMPLNREGLWSLSLSSGATKTYQLSKNSKLVLRPGLTVNYLNNIVILNENEANQRMLLLTGSFEYSLNLNDKIDISQSYRVTTTSSNFPNKELIGYRLVIHRLENSIALRPTKRLTVENSAVYQYLPNSPSDILNSNLLWNASIKYSFAKDARYMIRISGFDILNRNIGLNRVVSENFIQSTQTTILDRYFLFTFIYNLKSFSLGKESKSSLF